jgi:hypothetical protein
MTSDEVLYFLYDFLEKRMTPEALNTFISKGLKARGSKSVNGVMRMLADIHSQRRIRYDRTNNIPRPSRDRQDDNAT